MVDVEELRLATAILASDNMWSGFARLNGEALTELEQLRAGLAALVEQLPPEIHDQACDDSPLGAAIRQTNRLVER